VLKRVRRSAGRCPSLVMTWVSLTKPLGSVHDMLTCGDGPDVNVTTQEKKNWMHSWPFRDNTVSFGLIPSMGPVL